MSPDLAGAPPDPLTWLALAIAAAMTRAAAVAAATLATERQRGTAGWMATRAVPRPAIVLSWFVAFAVLIVAGLVPAAAVAWLSLEPFLPGPGALVAATAGAACAGGAALAIGLLAGSGLPRWPAAAVTAIVAAAFLLPPTLVQGAGAGGATSALSGAWWLPADGLRVLATLDTAARPVADSLRGAGVALGLAAVVLVAAVATFERADL
jgi:hypothetical protein